MVGSVTQFIREVRQELKKVTWPTREELTGSTTVVIVTTLLMAIFIGTVDFFLSLLIRVLIR
ncbi:MAG: preprotein translocase subunit SecE [Candidatus Omnitrophica bacterium]|nr:preprotein translocase subunit SecE [Candidatus Omnitrophota bacterium]